MTANHIITIFFQSIVSYIKQTHHINLTFFRVIIYGINISHCGVYVNISTLFLISLWVHKQKCTVFVRTVHLSVL